MLFEQEVKRMPRRRLVTYSSIALAGALSWSWVLGCGEPEERPPGIAAGWSYQAVSTVISSGRDGQRNVRLQADEKGELHVAAPAGGILYGRLAPGARTWRLEQIAEATNVSHWFGFGVTPAGSAHFVYYDDQSQSLRYIRPLPSGWESEEIDDGSDLGHEGLTDIGHYCDVAMGPEETPHVSYHDNTGGTGPDAFTLRYAFRATFTGWHTETVRQRTLGSVGEWTAIAVDGVGRVHIAYQDADESPMERLNVARKDGSTWQDERIVDAENGGYETDIALDTEGNPHVVHLDSSNLEYVHYDAANFVWVHDAIEEGLGAVKVAITLDADDRPHIVFCRGIGHPRIEYIYSDGDRWQMTTVDNGVGRGGQGGCGAVAIALDDGRRPHILYANRQELDVPASAALHHVWRDP